MDIDTISVISNRRSWYYLINFFLILTILEALCSCNGFLGPLLYPAGFDVKLQSHSIAITKGGSDSLALEAILVPFPPKQYPNLWVLVRDISPLNQGIHIRFNPSGFYSMKDDSLYRLFIIVNVDTNVNIRDYIIKLVISTGGRDSLNRSFTLKVVSSIPKYEFELVPQSINITAGEKDSAIIKINRLPNFSENVQFSEISNTPGITATFVPPSTTGNLSNIYIDVQTNVSPGQYTLQVKGRSQVTQTEFSQNLTVNVMSNISGMTISPNYMVIYPGTPGTANVTINRVGCSDVIFPALTGGNNTYDFIPYSLSGSQSTCLVTVQPRISTIPEQYIYRLFSFNCGFNNNKDLLTILNLPFETQGKFQIIPTKTRINQAAGDSTVITFKILRFQNFSLPINLSAENLPAGDSVWFDNPVNMVGNISKVYYKRKNPFNSGFILKGVSGTIASTVPISAETFYSSIGFVDLEIPPTISVQRNHSVNLPINLVRHNFNNNVELNWTGLDGNLEGITGSFTDPTPSGNTSSLQLSLEDRVPTGDYIFQVQAFCSGSGQYYGYFILTVLP